jgi:hypothetical protein
MMASAAVPGVPAVVDAAGLLSPPDDALIARMEKGELIPVFCCVHTMLMFSCISPTALFSTAASSAHCLVGCHTPS